MPYIAILHLMDTVLAWDATPSFRKRARRNVDNVQALAIEKRLVDECIHRPYLQWLALKELGNDRSPKFAQENFKWRMIIHVCAY
jgi:hypothetical protein